MLDAVYQFLQRLGYPHPIHPTEVHIPIGGVILALLFGCWALLSGRRNLYLSARHCIVAALVFLLPTVLFGYMDWQHFYLGAWLFPIKVKIILAGILLTLMTMAVVLSYKLGAESKLVLSLYLLSFVTVVGLGYYGGNLVYGSRTPSAPLNLKSGESVFDSKCSGCHPQGGNAIIPKLALISYPQLKDYKQFLDYIRNPTMPDGSKGIMPAFPPTKISDEEAKDLYQYVTEVLAVSR